MYMPWTGNLYGWGLLVMLLHMVIWGAFIVGIAYLIIKIIRGPGYDPRNNALDILKRRYAAGEINDEDFEKMKDRIR